MGNFAKSWLAAACATVAVIIVAILATGGLAHVHSLNPGSLNLDKVRSTFASTNSTIQDSSVPRVTEASVPSVDASARSLASRGAGPDSTTNARKTADLNSAGQERSALASVSAKASSLQISNSVPSSIGEHSQLGQSTPSMQPQLVSFELSPGPISAASILPTEVTGLTRTTGSVRLDGTLIKEFAPVFANDRIETPTQNGALVTAKGTAIALGVNTQFVAEKNSFSLDAGSSKVNTSTGMAARAGDYTVTPRETTAPAQYEVTWEGNSLYVYARTGDVEITSRCGNTRVAQGRAVKVRNARNCKAGITWLDRSPSWPGPVFAGVSSGAAIVVTCITLQNHQPISGDGFCR